MSRIGSSPTKRSGFSTTSTCVRTRSRPRPPTRGSSSAPASRSAATCRTTARPRRATSRVEAARRAIADAGLEPKDIDCIILGTLSPDFHFPGTAVLVQKKLGIADKTNCACFDIRQQCSAFVYGMQMADAFVRTGIYKRILLIGAELHSHSLDFSTRGRDVMVLFGDGAGAMVLGPAETDDARSRRDLHRRHTPTGTARWISTSRSSRSRTCRTSTTIRAIASTTSMMYPHMDGKRVFLNAVRGMVMSTQAALQKTGLTWDDIQWFVPHQANLRINEKVVEVAEDPAGQGAQHHPVLRQHHGGDGAAHDRLLAPAGQGEEGRPDLVVGVRLRLHLGRRDLHDLSTG